ncbi:hypothetical protein [uncultured Methanobrevibacter sp.]|uniref:hypothetical protein n=1 Tax=uncultured Methanobrevibacter sp. TaxID=253161 RepID=UPI00262805EA|nr:hypothetical protein [uncultured Methanobrevibacter sp.]
MTNNTKIQEYIDTLENDKLLLETHFANIERIIKENDDLNQDKVLSLLSKFNTFNIQYDQLCHDLITFIKIFKIDKEEIRIYKTEELIELLETKVNEVYH